MGALRGVAPAEAVRSRVLRVVSLGLDDAAADPVHQQPRTDQVGSDGFGRSVEEGGRHGGSTIRAARRFHPASSLSAC